MQTDNMDHRHSAPEVARLEQENRVLRERLAFYEGFDQLIQENVEHARELFRHAAQEKEAASAEVQRARSEVESRQSQLREHVEAIGAEVAALAASVDALSRRVAGVLVHLAGEGTLSSTADAHEVRHVAVVAHGVSSVRSARSLQQFVASMPQVTAVTAREYAGGVLRLDASVHESLSVDQFRRWEGSRAIEGLTDRPEVVEFALTGG